MRNAITYRGGVVVASLIEGRVCVVPSLIDGRMSEFTYTFLNLRHCSEHIYFSTI